MNRKTNNKNKFHFKKSFGQNFLQDDEVLENIILFSGINEEDTVLEIGAGSGNLTRYLSNISKNVLAIELDKTLIPKLDKEFENSNVHIINKDFLKISTEELKHIFEELFNVSDNIKVCANIPYNITSQIVNKIIEMDFIKEATLMVQKEVAERLSADVNNSNYSIFTLTTRIFCDTEFGFVVKKENFYPIPKVDSAVIKLIKHKKNIEDNIINGVIKIIKISFSQKRKMLINTLYHKLNIEKNILENIFTDLSLDLNARPENLTLETYVKLYEKLKMYLK